MNQDIEKNYKLSRRNFIKIIGAGTLYGLSRFLENNSQEIPPESLSPEPSLIRSPTIPARNTPTPPRERREQPTDSHSMETPETRETKQPTELQRLVERYGPALIIPAFEYHGDNYSGEYGMNPSTFREQMGWLRDNDFHAVTGPELAGFLDGSLRLPSRSVILTTDSGNPSTASIPRMLAVLEEYRLHFHTFIWTWAMEESETVRCRGDICWEVFRQAAESGLFTIGSHIESHADFSQMTPQTGIEDILASKREIEEHLGVEVYSISWPFESYPDWANQLKNYGFSYAFGGYSAPILECQVGFGDPEGFRWNLPRLLPPNVNGVSVRPNGKTLEEIMWENTTPSP